MRQMCPLSTVTDRALNPPPSLGDRGPDTVGRQVVFLTPLREPVFEALCVNHTLAALGMDNIRLPYYMQLFANATSLRNLKAMNVTMPNLYHITLL